jgi:hypothetical protein
VKHVPNGAQNPVANLLADFLNRAVSSGALDDVAKLLFMPGFVLAPLVRGGKKHDGKSAKIVEERITRFLAGEFEPEAASTRRRKPLVFPSEGLSSATERMVVNAVRDKSLSKACKLLLNGSLPAPVNVQEKLEALHPAGEIPADHDAAPGSFDFDESEVESALRLFDPSSGGGPSGLRPRHLQELLRGSSRERLVQALASFCSALANGHFSTQCMKLLTAARLVALPKRDNGLRPIAMGDTLRRLAAKCLHSRVLESVSTYVTPLQVGVQVPNAAELVARKVTHWARAPPPGTATLQIDVKNAFNSLSRGALLSAVKSRLPALYPYALKCYDHPTALFGEGFCLESSRGVQQGDVCGPALFALTIHDVVLKLDASWTSSAWTTSSGTSLTACSAARPRCSAKPSN